MLYERANWNEKGIILLIPLLISFHCKSQDHKLIINESITNESNITDSFTDSQVHKLDSLWNILVFEKGGCLTGGQRVINGRFGAEGCVMSDYFRKGNEWKSFFSFSKTELTFFLVEKLSDTTETKIHTCPCYLATNGEVAVYALHKIHMINWYDLDYFKSYSLKKGSGCMNSQQAWLQEILSNEKQRELLANCWIEKVN